MANEHVLAILYKALGGHQLNGKIILSDRSNEAVVTELPQDLKSVYHSSSRSEVNCYPDLTGFLRDSGSDCDTA